MPRLRASQFETANRKGGAPRGSPYPKLDGREPVEHRPLGAQPRRPRERRQVRKARRQVDPAPRRPEGIEDLDARGALNMAGAAAEPPASVPGPGRPGPGRRRGPGWARWRRGPGGRGAAGPGLMAEPGLWPARRRGRRRPGYRTGPGRELPVLGQAPVGLGDDPAGQPSSLASTLVAGSPLPTGMRPSEMARRRCWASQSARPPAGASARSSCRKSAPLMDHSS